jgi:hypothetical protein
MEEREGLYNFKVTTAHGGQGGTRLAIYGRIRIRERSRQCGKHNSFNCDIKVKETHRSILIQKAEPLRSQAALVLKYHDL